ncbi:hypothetical protein BDQ94DRAFT_150886 [Aspergillus welwitschiae]|uniref:Uncharacterized protein n=1 Tax=Aspergillus welwitschiae TaxID=1341132 RepID=A0A3F3PQQ1_9EURO|nr:hypothetical protein BDQ94DRAFT_150886 [Aspergillus welwitschiae]RDH29280.1 hypothetical protein BDQ94DRAFT_150886 [Aspergillus welwitschiae]
MPRVSHAGWLMATLATMATGMRKAAGYLGSRHPWVGVIVPVAIFPVEITAVTIKTPQPGWLGLRIVKYRFHDSHSTTYPTYPDL